jgi:hypothetical protein
MTIVHGYLAIIPNSPDGRGMLYFTKEKAIESAKAFNDYVEAKWDDPESDLRKQWKEKPEREIVCELVIRDDVYYE